MCRSFQTVALSVLLVHFCIFSLSAKWLQSPSLIYGKDVLEALRLPPETREALTTPQCLLLPSSLSHLNSRMNKKMFNPAENLALALKLHSHRQVWDTGGFAISENMWDEIEREKQCRLNSWHLSSLQEIMIAFKKQLIFWFAYYFCQSCFRFFNKALKHVLKIYWWAVHFQIYRYFR